MRRILRHMVTSSLLCGMLMSVHAAENDTAIKVKWGYVGHLGPASWGELSPDFALCADGKAQSPVNITKKTSSAPAALQIHYQSAPLDIVKNGNTTLTIGQTQTIINDGHGVQVNFPGNTSEVITLDNTNYRLVQFHVHSPSETAFRGQTAPLEIHFVHQGDNGKLAVIGVLVKGGLENPDLQKIINNLPRKSGQEVEVKDVQINPAALLPTPLDYYHFMGSLTTPPCSEGVEWVVMSNMISASPAQIVQLRKAIGGSNARPVQPLNGRMITYSKLNAENGTGK